MWVWGPHTKRWNLVRLTDVNATHERWLYTGLAPTWRHDPSYWWHKRYRGS